jgi:hypothetical protein
MVQAAARGVVDFTRAVPRDRRWWLKLGLLLAQIEDDNLTTAQRLDHAGAAALVGRETLTASSLEALVERLTVTTRQIKQRLFPWVEFDGRATLVKSVDALKKRYLEEYGDPNRPEAQAELAAYQAKLAADRKKRP